jgi:hypothetical protein
LPIYRKAETRSTGSPPPIIAAGKYLVARGKEKQWEGEKKKRREREKREREKSNKSGMRFIGRNEPLIRGQRQRDISSHDV